VGEPAHTPVQLRIERFVAMRIDNPDDAQQVKDGPRYEGWW
jgi:hypothetical protein